MSDIDTEAVSSSSNHKRYKKDIDDLFRINGPTTLEGILELNALNARRLHEYCLSCPDLLAILAEWVTQPLVVTSSFTGFATFEHSILVCRRELATLLGVVPGSLIYYAAWECADHAKRMILGNPMTRPEHLFDDVLSRLPENDKNDLMQIAAENISLADAIKKELKCGSITNKQAGEERAEIGEANRKELQDKLVDIEFNLMAWCSIHEGMCPVTPRQKYPGHRWIEGAGTVCCPFSSMSDNPSWCDASTLSTLTWAYGIRFGEPDDICHECVSGFPHEVFIKIFDEKGLVMKSVYAPHSVAQPMLAAAGADQTKDTGVGSHAETDCYVGRWRKLSPTDLGVPSERVRKYGWYKHGRRAGKPLECGFDELFGRTMLADASIYLVAPRSWRVQENSLWRRQSRRRPGEGEGSDSNIDQELTRSSGDFDRLVDYKRLAVERGLCSNAHKDWIVPVAVVNVFQNASFMKQINTKAFPAILQRSIPVDLVQEVRVIVPELWLVQGLPYPGLVNASTPAAHARFDEWQASVKAIVRRLQ